MSNKGSPMHFVQAKSLLTRWNGMNLYRGCTHGCAYCDSRSACYQIGHAFEDVAVKVNAPELLEDVLRRRRKPCMIGTGSMSDPYQPIERDLRLTRRCLELIRDYGFGASVITKSDLVLRDIDLLEDVNRRTKAVVQVTLTIADDGLSRVVEPGVCPSSRRFEVLCELRDRHIPTMVWLCPFLPWLTDTDANFLTLLDWCVEAQVKGHRVLRRWADLARGQPRALLCVSRPALPRAVGSLSCHIRQCVQRGEREQRPPDGPLRRRVRTARHLAHAR